MLGRSWFFMQHFAYYISEDACLVHYSKLQYSIANFSYSRRSVTESLDRVCVVIFVRDAWPRESCKLFFFFLSFSLVLVHSTVLLHTYFNSRQGCQIMMYSALFYQTSLYVFGESFKIFFFFLDRFHSLEMQCLLLSTIRKDSWLFL